MGRNDYSPGWVYILHSERKSATSGGHSLVFKFGLSRDVEKRVRFLNQPRHKTPRGRCEGAYAGVRDWTIVEKWRVQNMRAKEDILGAQLFALGNRHFEPGTDSLFKATSCQLDSLIAHITQICDEAPVAHSSDEDYDYTQDYRGLEETQSEYGDESDFEEDEVDEIEEWRTVEEILSLLDGLSEFYAKAKEDGWPYSDDDFA